MHGQPNQSEIRESAPRKRSFQAHSDNLEEFVEKFTFPQWMDTDARPELDLTSAFEKIGQVSVENSIADFTKWTKEKRASRTRENRRPKRTANAKGIIFIFHEDEEPPVVAPKAARMPQANQNQLECLYGPQQIITNVFSSDRLANKSNFW